MSICRVALCPGLALKPFITLVLLGVGASAWGYDLRDNVILHAHRGERLMETGQAREAVEEFRTALLLNPDTGLSASIYHELGLAYRALRQYPYAIAAFQRACRIQPTFALYYRSLVETYAAAGVLPQAVGSLSDIAAQNPENAEAWFLLGLMHQALGLSAESREDFQRFLELQPDAELARAARSYLGAHRGPHPP